MEKLTEENDTILEFLAEEDDDETVNDERWRYANDQTLKSSLSIPENDKHRHSRAWQWICSA